LSIATAAQFGPHDHRLLIVGRKRVAAGLLGSDRDSPRLAADEDRDAEKRPHWRMAGREAVGARVVADIVETQRAGLVDEHAEQAAPAWQIADRAVGLLVDAAREKARQLAAIVVEMPSAA
jgi:hypothetical protein